MQPEEPDLYADDDSHPIPLLNNVDVVLDLEGGASYGIVVSEPLTNDVRSRARLIRKLENYVRSFKSEEFRRTHGTPRPGKLRIYVRLHAGSDQALFDLLESKRAWLSENNVSLKFGRTKFSQN
jgi:hypothetical protein